MVDIKENEEELKKRIDIVSIITQAMMPIETTIGITGSTANGNMRSTSDLDLFLIINAEHIKDIIDKIYNLRTFQTPSIEVISGFKKGQISIIFLYGELQNVSVNIEIYSLEMVRRLLGLENIEVVRFRTKPTSQFLTFGNAYGESIPMEMKIQRFAEGNLSSLPGNAKIDGIVYVGNHLRKLLFGKIYQDNHHIKELVHDCFSYFVAEAINNNKFSDQCFINLSIFDLIKKLNDNARKFYRDLCMDIYSELKQK